MARLPAGWVFIPIIKNRTEIEIKKMELVTCKDCKWCDPKDRKCKHADMGSPFPRPADFFCAWGEEI